MTALIVAGIVLGALAAWTLIATLLGIGVGRFMRSGHDDQDGDQQ